MDGIVNKITSEIQEVLITCSILMIPESSAEVTLFVQITVFVVIFLSRK